MVRVLSVMGSSMVDTSNSSPSLCLDALSSCNLGVGTSVLHRNHLGSLELSTSFVGLRLSAKCFRGNNYKCLKKQTKRKKSLMVVGNLGGQYEESFEDIKTQILNYITFKAVRAVLDQLYEENRPQYQWFYDYVATNKPRDGKRFIRNLVKVEQDLAERVMETRLRLYGKWIKKCDHEDIYNRLSDQNVEVMRERLMETVIWPSDDTNTEIVG